jgi:hypothetical protein
MVLFHIGNSEYYTGNIAGRNKNDMAIQIHNAEAHFLISHDWDRLSHFRCGFLMCDVMLDFSSWLPTVLARFCSELRGFNSSQFRCGFLMGNVTLAFSPWLPTVTARFRSGLAVFNSTKTSSKVCFTTEKEGLLSTSADQQHFINHCNGTGQWAVWEESILGRSPPSTTSFKCFLLEYPWNGFSIEHISHNKIPNEYRSTDLLYVLSLATTRKMEC